MHTDTDADEHEHMLTKSVYLVTNQVHGCTVLGIDGLKKGIEQYPLLLGVLKSVHIMVDLSLRSLQIITLIMTSSLSKTSTHIS
jgi:hypothetical protein